LEEVLSALETTCSGLTRTEAEQRLLRVGHNRLIEAVQRSPMAIVLA
jgi:hypothetical protein